MSLDGIRMTRITFPAWSVAVALLFKRKFVYCFRRTRVRLPGRRVGGGVSDLQNFSEKLLRKAEGERAHIAT